MHMEMDESLKPTQYQLTSQLAFQAKSRSDYIQN